MTDSLALLPSLHRSTADLIRGLTASNWTDADAAAPSLCDGWTRGHVLTHLARNADGMAATLAGALRGEIVERYPDGWESRNHAIEEGAGRPFAELLEDVSSSAYRLERTLADVADVDAWDRPTAEDRRAADWIWWRFREIEIHRVDLAGDYTAADWPAELIAEQLPQALETLADRVTGAVTIEIDPDGSRVVELADHQVTVGDGEPAIVRGPDWAVLAWLVGRPTAAAGHLTATPPLAPWR